MSTYDNDSIALGALLIGQTKGDIAQARRHAHGAWKWLCSVDPSVDPSVADEAPAPMPVKAAPAPAPAPVKAAPAPAPMPVKAAPAPSSDPYAGLPEAIRQYAMRRDLANLEID